jgi:hypothetical protein
MKMSTRLIACLILAGAAFFFQHEFIEYDIRPLHASSNASDVLSPGDGEIIFLGLTTITPKPGSDLVRFHGRVGAERAIFTRNGHAVCSAIIGGLLVPILLTLSAAYLLLRRQRCAVPEISP